MIKKKIIFETIEQENMQNNFVVPIFTLIYCKKIMINDKAK